MDKGSLIIGGIAVLVFAGIIFLASQQTSTSEQAAISIDGLETYERPERLHTEDAVEYEQTPPVGGNHRGWWLACNGSVYDEPVENEQAVHALEHGAVWITYNESAGTSTTEALVNRLGGYTFLSPVPNQDASIKLTAWGNQLAVTSVDDPRIDKFLDKFRQGPQTPEPGATCNAPGGRRM